MCHMFVVFEVPHGTDCQRNRFREMQYKVSSHTLKRPYRVPGYSDFPVPTFRSAGPVISLVAAMYSKSFNWQMPTIPLPLYYIPYIRLAATECRLLDF